MVLILKTVICCNFYNELITACNYNYYFVLLYLQTHLNIMLKDAYKQSIVVLNCQQNKSTYDS